MIIIQCSFFLVPLPCLLEWFHHSKGEIPGYSCLPPPWSQQCCMPFERPGLLCTMVCSVSSDCSVHIQIIPIMPDSSVHHNYSELLISSRPTHWAISNQVVMLLQYIANENSCLWQQVSSEILWYQPLLDPLLSTVHPSVRWYCPMYQVNSFRHFNTQRVFYLLIHILSLLMFIKCHVVMSWALYIMLSTTRGFFPPICS